MTKEEIVIYRQKLLEALWAFQQLCNNNNIRYVGAYGTMLGAVRHKGLIPWDDDIDVFMSRSDYDQFLSLASSLDQDYEICDYHNEGYPCSYAKFMDKKTSLWEQEEKPYMTGVFIDVFPLDEVPGKSAFELKDKCQLAWKNVSASMYSFSISRFIKDILQLKKSKCRYEISHLKRRGMYKKDIEQYDAIIDEFRQIHGNYYTRITVGDTRIYPLYPKEWFLETIEVPFENRSIVIPKNYDKILKHDYGDYMTLPPVEQRTSQHYHYFVDLNRRYSIAEAKDKMNKKRK